MINNTKAKFITFEGCEGSGKSTQSKMLHEFLESKGLRAILTREIGGTIEAEKIRNILLHSNLLPTSELMLVMAARFEHLHKLIIPALGNGTWVICDRFIDSTAAYQGQHDDIGIEKIYELHKSIISKIMPDITFFIDVDSKIGLERAKKRGNNNKFEEKDIDFHLMISKSFRTISKRFQDRIIKINGQDLSKEDIHHKILSHFDI
jgi:dTMP kinase